jgi:predicted DNA-binding protein (MmcQ/YjbR family)
LTRDELHAAAMALPGAELDIKWGSDHCYCVAGKMFCATGPDYASLSFKASDIAFEALTGTGRATPAKYLARARWLTLADLAAAEASEVAAWVRTAYGLVAAKLPRKLQRDLGLP